MAVHHHVLQLAKKISPSMDIGPLSAPYTLVPLLAMAQLVHVARPGQEPDVAQPFAEDMRLFDSCLAEPGGAHSLRVKQMQGPFTCRRIARCLGFAAFVC